MEARMAQSNAYYQKLQDPRWQRKRLEVMQYADFMCEECGSKISQLHIHHGHYEQCEPWEYEAYELRCLCSKCHGLIESKLRDIRKMIGCMTLDQLTRVFECSNIIYHEIFVPPESDSSPISPEEALRFVNSNASN